MYCRSTELYHHGVKGMKWGVRRKRYKYYKNTVRDATTKYRNAQHENRMARANASKLIKKVNEAENAHKEKVLNKVKDKSSFGNIMAQHKETVKYGAKFAAAFIAVHGTNTAVNALMNTDASYKVKRGADIARKLVIGTASAGMVWSSIRGRADIAYMEKYRKEQKVKR